MAPLGLFVLPLTWYCAQLEDNTNRYTYTCEMKDMSKGHFTLCEGLRIDQPVIVIKSWKPLFHLRTCDKKEIIIYPASSVNCTNVPLAVTACVSFMCSSHKILNVTHYYYLASISTSI